MKTEVQYDAEIERARADLDASRREIRVLQDKLRAVRIRRDAALLAFQSGFDKIDPVANARSEIAKAQARKAQNVSEGRGPDVCDTSQPRGYRSRIDMLAEHSRGSVEGGKWGSWKRGNRSTRGARAKIPSES